ncbi:MAG: fimbrillin family protein [Prevotella sp.]|nr:fimbrillin family protein [Prevotella sp.]
MNHKISSITQLSIFCVLLGMGGCADYEAAETVADSGDPIELHCEVLQQYVTRANDMGFATGDEIGVFIVNRDENDGQLMLTGNHADNVLFTYRAEDGTWTGARQLYWKDKQTHIDAYGYYPFDEGMSSVAAYPFQIQHNQRDQLKTGRRLTGYEASDFLWAKAEDYVPTGGPVILKHHHLMAGIQVSLVQGEGFDEGEWDELDKTVLVENTCLTTTINIGTGEVSVAQDAGVTNIIPQEKSEVWRAVVAPQTVAAQKSLLSITVGGDTHRFTRNEEMVYYPGKLHKFTIEVIKRLPSGDYQFNLLSEAITPWENDPESHNGQAREYLTINLPDVFTDLSQILDSLGVDPAEVINLKLTGVVGSEIVGYRDYGEAIWGGLEERNIRFIRENMPRLEGLNMQHLRFKNINTGWGEKKDDYIPRLAFYEMSNLSYVTLPDNLKGVLGGAFNGTSMRGSLIFPENFEFLGQESFANCLLTGELHLPSTLKNIEMYAFGGRKNCYLTGDFVLPEYMESLGGYAFGACRYLTGPIRIPRGLEDVNNGWPDNAKGPVVIPQGVKRIHSLPYGMTSLYIPEGVEEISGCGTPNLRGDVHLPSTLRKLHSGAFFNAYISHINLPEGLESIEDETFKWCIFLQDTITIPSTVTRIKRNAFQDCRMLNAVVIPASVEEIQDWAFSGCYSLDYIECQAKEPPAITELTFSGVEKNNFTLVVPEDAVEDYKNAPNWCEFKRISAYRNFVCRPMKAKLLNKGHEREVVLNADSHWQVASCPSWMHVSQTSGYKKTELTITIDDMPHNQGDREGAVVFQLDRTDDDGQPITCTYTVKQFDYEVEEDGIAVLQHATKGERGGIDIIFLGDGYDAEDIATNVYSNTMTQEMEYFFAVEPYKTYRDYFNVSVAFAMSYESGIHDNPDKWRQPKFNTQYGVTDTGRMQFNFDGCMRYVLQDVISSPITTVNVNRSLIIAIPNSEGYEGVTMLYQDGSAIAVCPYFEGGDYPYDSRGILQHEACGHAWGKLDDEYIYHRNNINKCACNCCSHADNITFCKSIGWFRNVSLSGKYKDCEWRHLLIDHRYDDIVDIYEGAHMHGDGVFRSEINSCMNNNVPYFSTISRQAIVERILWAAGEPFDFETFVSLDSREMGNKFLTRGAEDKALDSVPSIYDEHHGPIIRKGSPMEYLKKKKGGMQ